MKSSAFPLDADAFLVDAAARTCAVAEQIADMAHALEAQTNTIRQQLGAGDVSAAATRLAQELRQLADDTLQLGETGRSLQRVVRASGRGTTPPTF